MNNNGKGDKIRPCQISHIKWQKNWDRIFKGLASDVQHKRMGCIKRQTKEETDGRGS